MHNVVNIIINKVISLYIPDMVLRAGFRRELDGVTTIEEVLRSKIIVGIVLQDCNLYAGKITKIVLKPEYAKSLKPENTIYHNTGYFSIYEIPPEAREYKDLTAVIDIVRPVSYDNPPSCGGSVSFNTMGSLTNDVFNSVAGGQVSIEPTPILLANNVVRIEPPFVTHMDWVLSCLLAYDENFSNITPNMVEPLVTLVVLATKAYLYNKLINDNQLSTIVGGATFDSFSSIVEGYESANEDYKEAILNFRGAATFDKDSLVSMIGMML